MPNDLAWHQRSVVSDVSQVLDRLDREDAERAAAEQQLRAAFAQAMQGPARAIALFARARSSGERPKVHELLEDQLAYSDFGQRAMQILIDAAAGRGTQRHAQQLLADIGAHWADREADYL